MTGLTLVRAPRRATSARCGLVYLWPLCTTRSETRSANPPLALGDTRWMTYERLGGSSYRSGWSGRTSILPASMFRPRKHQSRCYRWSQPMILWSCWLVHPGRHPRSPRPQWLPMSIAWPFLCSSWPNRSVVVKGQPARRVGPRVGRHEGRKSKWACLARARIS